MSKRFARLAVLSFLMLAATGVMTVEAQKIGYTDHELIIVNMPEYRTVQEQLQKDYQTGQSELQALYADYQEKLDRYQKQQALLSQETRQKREKELQDLQQKIQQNSQQKEQVISQKQAELMRPLFERVQTTIDEVAKEKGLDLIIRSQVGDQPVILYRNEANIPDITIDVAKRLGLNVNDSTAAPVAAPVTQAPAGN